MKLIHILLAALLCFPVFAAAKKSRSATSSATAHVKSQPKVHVRQYSRKDGTVVRSHKRSYPGTKNAKK